MENDLLVENWGITKTYKSLTNQNDQILVRQEKENYDRASKFQWLQRQAEKWLWNSPEAGGEQTFHV